MSQDLQTILKVARARRGLTQADVARHFRRSQPWYAALEAGNSALSQDLVFEMALFLEVDVVELHQAQLRRDFPQGAGEGGAIEAFSEETVAAAANSASTKEKPIITEASPLSAKEIRDKALRVHKQLLGESQAAWGTAVDLERVVSRLQSRDPTICEILPKECSLFDVIFGTFGRDEDTAEGRVSFDAGRQAFTIELRQDVLARLYAGNGRARYALAHELGHLALHANELVRHEGQALRDTFMSAHRRSNVAPFRDPEWQCNCFAAAFLVPDEALKTYLIHQADRDEVDVRHLATHFGVSLTVASIRLGQVLPQIVKGGGMAQP